MKGYTELIRGFRGSCKKWREINYSHFHFLDPPQVTVSNPNNVIFTRKYGLVCTPYAFNPVQIAMSFQVYPYLVDV